MCTTGTGTTIAVTAANGGAVIAIGRISEFGSFEEEITDISDNDISTVGHEQYCPGNLIGHTELPMTVIFEGQVPPDLGTLANVVLTFQTPEGLTTGATFTATGWLKKRGWSGIQNNERVTGDWAFRFSGKNGTFNTIVHTPPTWSAAA